MSEMTTKQMTEAFMAAHEVLKAQRRLVMKLRDKLACMTTELAERIAPLDIVYGEIRSVEVHGTRFLVEQTHGGYDLEISE